MIVEEVIQPMPAQVPSIISRGSLRNSVIMAPAGPAGPNFGPPMQIPVSDISYSKIAPMRTSLVHSNLDLRPRPIMAPGPIMVPPPV